MNPTIQEVITLITQLKAQADQLVTDNTTASQAYASVLAFLAKLPDPTVAFSDAITTVQTAMTAQAATLAPAVPNAPATDATSTETATPSTSPDTTSTAPVANSQPASSPAP